jgi:homoserine O-acetyltransferase
MSADLGTVDNRSFFLSNLRLQNGNVMPTAKIVYETYGGLATNRRNAVLITHGYASSHHAAGRNPANGNLPGWWDG